MFDKPLGKISGFSSYGYLVKPYNYNIPRFINYLQENGIRLKSSSKVFKIKNNYFDYGSLLIPVVGQSKKPEKIFELLTEISKNRN